MAEQVDVYKLIVEVEGAQTIGQLENGLKTLREELKNKDIGSKEFKELKNVISDTELQLNAATESGKQFGANFSSAASGMVSGFQAATGAMAVFSNGSEQSIEAMAHLQGLMQLREGIGGIKNAIVSMSGLEGALAKGIRGVNGLKVAFMSLGIGVVVAAVTALIAAFARFDSLAEKLEVGIAAIKGAFDALLDTIALLGSALIKLFTGDFKGAAEDAGNAIGGFNQRMKESVTSSMDATKAAQELEDAEIDLIVTQAQLRRSIAENREIISDETATIKEKMNAINEAKTASKTYYENEMRLAKMRLDQLKLETKSRVELTDDQRKAIEEAKANIIQLEEASAREERTLNRDQKRVNNEREQLNKEAFERKKKRIEDDIKYEIERLTLLGQLTFDKEKEFLDKRFKAGIISQKEYDNALLKLQIDYQKQEQKQSEDYAKSEMEVSKTILQLEKEQLDDGLKDINDTFKAHQLKLMTDLINGTITEKEYKDQLVAEQEQQLRDEIALRETYGQDATDLQIKLAEIEIGINRDKNEKIKKDDQDIFDAKIKLAQEGSNIIGNITQFIIDQYGQQNAAAKAAALLQLGTDTALAYVSGLRIAQESAKATGPAAAFAFPIFYASQVAAIIGAVNKARQILGGGQSAPNLGGNYSTPVVNNQPQTVRAITGQQIFKVGVLIKDINNAQQKVNIIDGNSFVIE